MSCSASFHYMKISVKKVYCALLLFGLSEEQYLIALPDGRADFQD